MSSWTSRPSDLRRFSLLRSTPSTVIFKTVEFDEPLDSISNPQSSKVVGRRKKFTQFAPVVTSVKHTLDDDDFDRTRRDRGAGLKKTIGHCR